MQQSSRSTTPQPALVRQPDAKMQGHSKVLASQHTTSAASANLSNDNITEEQTGMRIFDELPTSRPKTPLLDQINNPSDLKHLNNKSLLNLADELREFLLYAAGQSGGHFGANLGVVELTIALHYLFNTPDDKLVWDVGHQAYAHKVLTGRREQLITIRSKNGLTAFPERQESEYDTFGVGHSSTSISAGLGMSLALRHTGSQAKVVSVIGDGAMTGGMAFEAMNDAVQQHADLMVILNDNDMSISCSIGGFSRHLAMLWESGYQVDISDQGEAMLKHRPEIPFTNRRARHSQQRDVPRVADNLFKAIGFSYFGPFDGHNLPELLRVIERAKKITGPVLIHVYTTKGKGFVPAESDPVGYHAIAKVAAPQAINRSLIGDKDAIQIDVKPKKFSQVFGEFICDKAKSDSKLMAITPAMEEGSGMTDFARQYPEHFFDVAIAEQHAVTVAAGMATQNVKPIVAIYSTFLQRGYDQLIHDVALQNLDVMFAIDRAGLVGEDGATHAGVFDLAYMRCVPNMVIATPKDEEECYQLLNTCYEHKGPTAVRYPRGLGIGSIITKPAQIFNIGRSQIAGAFSSSQATSRNLQATKQTNNTTDENSISPTQSSSVVSKIAVLAFGPIVYTAMNAVKKLLDYKEVAEPFEIKVINMRWVKPLDTTMIDNLITEGFTRLVTLEEHSTMGGAGSAVNEYILNNSALQCSPPISVKNIGIPDRFIAHGSHDEQLADCGLDVSGIMLQIKQIINYG